MAITEDFLSREMHITVEGTDAQLVYTCTWTDWNNGGDGIITFPKIGTSINTQLNNTDFVGRDDLKCTDIQTYAIDNTNAKIVCLFSTASIDARQKKEDDKKSWSISFSTQIEPVDRTNSIWFKYTTPAISDSGNWYNWKNTYTTPVVDNGPGGSADELPELVIYEPRKTATINIYGSKLYIDRFMEIEGKVNSSDFFSYYFNDVQGNRIDVDSTGDDTGKWLCAQVDIERVNFKCWNYTFTFWYNKDGWQNYLFPNSGSTAINPYREADFKTFFNDMNLDLSENYSRE